MDNLWFYGNMVKLKKKTYQKTQNIPYILEFLTQILTYWQIKNKLSPMTYFTISTLPSAKLKSSKRSCSLHKPNDTSGTPLLRRPRFTSWQQGAV